MNGVSPTMNGTSSVLTRTGETGGGLIISNILNTPKDKPPVSHSSNGQESSVSSATVETIITMTPTDRQSPIQETLC